jgi:hypothetical protein
MVFVEMSIHPTIERSEVGIARVLEDIGGRSREYVSDLQGRVLRRVRVLPL